MIDTYNASLRQFLLDLQTNDRRLARAQSEVSSGLRVGKASDDPDAVTDIVEIRTGISRSEQTKNNLARAKNEVDTAEQALADSIKIVEHARTVGAQGATALADAAQRQLLAEQINGALTSLVKLSGTTVEGRYIFGGDSDQQAPYTIDLTQATPVSAYAGSASTRQVLDGDGSTLTIARTAQQIFEGTAPSQNVFTALMNLRTGLLQNDQSAILAAQDNLGTALDHLNAEQGQYGSFQNQVAGSTDSVNQQVARLQTELSGLQDTDMAVAATDMSRALLQQQASLSARSRIPQTSLFSYLA